MVARLFSPILSLLSLVAVLCAACGQPASTQTVCRDPVTQMCTPCNGGAYCVDPLTCNVIPCNQDITFGQSDANKLDGGSSETTMDASTDAVLDGIADSASPDAAPDSTPDIAADAAPDAQPDAKVPDSAVEAGGCKDPCPALGLVECVAGIAATRTCNLGGDGCLSWGLPIACKPGQTCSLGLCQTPGDCNPPCAAGQTCQAGQCVSSGGGGGTLSCAQVAACIGNCPASDATCPDKCKAQGTAIASSSLAAYQGCIKAVCKPLADQGKINETMLCIFSNCFAEQQACLGAGTQTCKQTSDCMATCGSSATCVSNCNAGASQQGGKDYYGLLSCLDNQCAGLAGQTQLNCAQTACQSLWKACYPSGGGGQVLYTTCAQVANCKGNCNGDAACAQACIDAASPGAVAAVNAFVACANTKCGAWCANNGPNCVPCLQQYCPSELAACSQ